MNLKREREIDLMSHGRPPKIQCSVRDQLRALQNLVANKPTPGTSNIKDDVKIKNIKKEEKNESLKNEVKKENVKDEITIDNVKDEKPTLKATSFVTDTDLVQLIYKSLVLHDRPPPAPTRAPRMDFLNFFKPKIETICLDSDDDSNDTIIMDSDEYADLTNVDSEDDCFIDSDDDCFILSANIDVKTEKETKDYQGLGTTSDDECAIISENVKPKRENLSGISSTSSSGVKISDRSSLLTENLVPKTEKISGISPSPSCSGVKIDNRSSLLTANIVPKIETSNDISFGSSSDINSRSKTEILNGISPASSSGIKTSFKSLLVPANILSEKENLSRISLGSSSDNKINNRSSLLTSNIVPEISAKSLFPFYKVPEANDEISINSSSDQKMDVRTPTANSVLKTKNVPDISINDRSFSSYIVPQADNEISVNSSSDILFKDRSSLISPKIVPKTGTILKSCEVDPKQSDDSSSNFIKDDELDEIICISEFMGTF